jgi:hypothetical protein
VAEGKPSAWPRTAFPLPFRFHYKYSTRLIREETKAAVREGFFRWSDVVCPDGRRTSLRFVEGEEITIDKPVGTKVRGEPFGIYFRDAGWARPNHSELALTTKDQLNGVFKYADIELNSADHDFYTRESASSSDAERDLQTVVTHEVGHYIGLDHSVEKESIMWEKMCETELRCSRGSVPARRLADDDMLAVCTLFPPEPLPDPSADAPPGGSCNVQPGTSRPRPAALLAVALTVPLAGLSRIIRKRRKLT